MRIAAPALAGAIVGACLFAASSAAAGSLEVAPTTVQFSADGKTAVLYVYNYGTATVTVQIEPCDWSEAGGADRLTPSDTLMASPPMATIPPQGKQTVRLMVTPQADRLERSFRLLVSELPDPMRRKDHSVQLLTQFSIPAFASGTAEEPGQLQWSAAIGAGQVTLTARNVGVRHLKLQDMKVTGADDNAQALGGLNYVLAGNSRSWKIPCRTCGAGAELRIQGTDEAAGTKFDDTVLVGQ